MFESSFRLGTLWGIRIGVHYTWLIIFVLLASSLYTVFITQHPDWSNGTCLFTACGDFDAVFYEYHIARIGP